MTSPERPVLDRRATYQTTDAAEVFIVGILKQAIEGILAESPAPPGAIALDVGCGSQPFRTHLEAAGYRYLSFDVMQNSQKSVDILGFIDSDLPSELLSQGPFSLILCTEVLEHVAGWQMAFDNLARLLGPGGKLLITCPHIYQLHEEPYDFWRPTIYAIRHHASRVGLEVLVEQKGGDAWDVLGTVLGFCRFAERSGGLVNLLLRKTMGMMRKVLLKMASSRSFRNRIELKGKTYLSNIFVLEKSTS